MKTSFIYQINRIIPTIPIKIRISPTIPNRILRSPSTNLRVIVPSSKSNQPSLLIINSTRVPEGEEAGVGVEEYAAELIILHPLDNLTGRNIDHQTWAAKPTSRSGKPDVLRLVRMTVPLRVNQADVARMASSIILSCDMLYKNFLSDERLLLLKLPSRALEKKILCRRTCKSIHLYTESK